MMRRGLCLIAVCCKEDLQVFVLIMFKAGASNVSTSLVNILSYAMYDRTMLVYSDRQQVVW